MSPRANPVQTQRKLTPGSLGGDKAAQPGQHVVILPGPPAPPAGGCVPGIAFNALETFNVADTDLDSTMAATMLWVPVTSPGVGLAWQVVSGQLYIPDPGGEPPKTYEVGNVAFGGDATVGFTVVDTVDPDQIGTARLVGPYVSRLGGGYVFGFITGSDDPAWPSWTGTDPGWVLDATSVGTYPHLGRASDPIDFDQVTPGPQAGDVLELEIVGTTITGKVNGTPLLSAVDATYAGATALPGDAAGMGGARDVHYDDFYIIASTVC